MARDFISATLMQVAVVDAEKVSRYKSKVIFLREEPAHKAGSFF
jgi:hypothetical protein